GFLGAAIRTLRGIPPYVWVINGHTEEITVVISKYRPHRFLSGGGLSVSSTGVGLDISTTTFNVPATTKVLASKLEDPERSIAAFPLWTRKDGFGVITIFTGSDKVLYIENDQVPIGARVYFTNRPDLRIVEY
ncbi:hypothetical protein GQ53DRAFT_588188, partial [Thozetella sp. PMI_491]